MVTSQMKVLEGNYKEKYVFFFQASLEKLDFKEVNSLGKEVVALVEKYNLKDVNLDAVVIPEQQLVDEFVNDDIPSELPRYFKISKLKGISKGTKEIHLEIDPNMIPTSVCGDGCGVNMKGSRLFEEMYGIKSPFTRCSSHASFGTIRCICTLKTMCQSDAQTLYGNLRKVLKHFSKSAKSSELLTEALDALELNQFHLRNWGGTRMAGFLDACQKASNIIIPFIDILIAGNIQPDETKFLASGKGNQVVVEKLAMSSSRASVWVWSKLRIFDVFKC